MSNGLLEGLTVLLLFINIKFKLYNCNFNSIEFSSLNFNQILTSRQTTFKIVKSNSWRIKLNSLANRLHHINDIIPLQLLNLSIGSFKVKSRNCCCEHRLIETKHWLWPDWVVKFQFFTFKPDSLSYFK